MATFNLIWLLLAVVWKDVVCLIWPSIHPDTWHQHQCLLFFSSLPPNQLKQMLKVCHVVCLCFIILFSRILFCLKWLLRQHLAFSNPDLFSCPQSENRLVGVGFTSSLLFLTALPTTPSRSGIPILSFICSPLSVSAPLCPCNMTSGQHQQWSPLCFSFTEAPVTSTSCCCVRPCHTVTDSRTALGTIVAELNQLDAVYCREGASGFLPFPDWPDWLHE